MVFLFLSVGALQKNKTKLKIGSFEISCEEKNWMDEAVKSAQNPLVFLVMIAFFIFLYIIQPTFQNDLISLMGSEKTGPALFASAIISFISAWLIISIQHREIKIIPKLVKIFMLFISILLNGAFSLYLLFGIVLGPITFAIDAINFVPGQSDMGISFNFILVVLGYLIYTIIAIFYISGIKIDRI
ncbi:MAG: hypothetical protein ABH842_06200 [Candidatus Micrarchaeota archaeon]